jgi:hypothetical protein
MLRCLLSARCGVCLTASCCIFSEVFSLLLFQPCQSAAPCSLAAVCRGHSFLSLNGNLLERYAACSTAVEVISAQAEQLEAMKSGGGPNRRLPAGLGGDCGSDDEEGEEEVDDGSYLRRGMLPPSESEEESTSEEEEEEVDEEAALKQPSSSSSDAEGKQQDEQQQQQGGGTRHSQPSNPQPSRQAGGPVVVEALQHLGLS